MKWILIAIAIAGFSVSAAAAQDIKIIPGVCGVPSFTATVGAVEDLGDHKIPFACDSAVVSFTDPTHIMIQFAEKQSSAVHILAYAGQVREDAQTIDVARVYLEPGKPLPAADGACKMFLKSAKVTDIVCGAEIQQGSQRTVGVVTFKANALAAP
jgi:hypothetical protein